MRLRCAGWPLALSAHAIAKACRSTLVHRSCECAAHIHIAHASCDRRMRPGCNYSDITLYSCTDHGLICVSWV